MSAPIIKSPPDVQFRVIGCGLGRTGTRSMKDALEIIGFGPCHHMVTLRDHPERRDIFLDAHAGKPVDWAKAMAGFGSTVDHPTTEFALDLMEAFPDAKVILTVRDNSAVWWRSMQSTIAFGMQWQNRLLMSSVFWRRGALSMGRALERWYTSNYGPMGPRSYERHNQRMMELVPKDKLLVFNVKEGWEPLCAFLEVPVPDVPFPRLNETKELAPFFRRMRMMGLTMWGVELGLLGFIVYHTIRRSLWRHLDIRKLWK